MFKISRKQWDNFQQEALGDFEDRMVAHVRESFPTQCETLGESALRETIRHGTGRAAVHGIVAENPVSKYIELIIQLGRDFDTDSRYPWASAILNNPDLAEPSDKVEELYNAAADVENIQL